MAPAFASAAAPPARRRTSLLPPCSPPHGPRRRAAVRRSPSATRRLAAASARVSGGRAPYRLSSLLPAEVVLPPIPASAPAPTEGARERADRGRYEVRGARTGELYTVADIRCEAFYGAGTDMYYYPVRRREIYMAMRDRLECGNRCLVVVDRCPPSEWRPFANEDGQLVVGSLDVSLHAAASGRRIGFGECVEGQGRRIYVSSMAVRGEWQRRGLARMLLGEVDVLAREFDVPDLFLHVEGDNTPAVGLYTSCGFVSTKLEDPALVPNWLHVLAKKEHTLMHKRAIKC